MRLAQLDAAREAFDLLLDAKLKARITELLFHNVGQLWAVQEQTEVQFG